MGAKRNNAIALITAGVFLGLGLIATAAEAQAADAPITPNLAAYHKVEAETFSRHLPAAFAHRNAHLVTFATFDQMRGDENTIILDTRSETRFKAGHMQGAINLPLSDMTLLTLADAVPDRSSRILIYSDRNIGPETAPLTLDTSALSLNMLTYITLYQYGYFDVFELGEVVAETIPELDWATPDLQLATLQSPTLN